MSDPAVKVLLVEDEMADAELLRAVLAESGSSSFELAHVSRLSEAMARLRQETFEVVLLDLNLPDRQGLDTFLALKGAAPAVPIVVVTGWDDQTLALQAVREGAQDFLIKGQVDGRLLGRVIRYAIERKRTVEELRAALVELEQSHAALHAAQAQLIQAERLEAVSTFAAGVAHEVKNPLQTIILGVDYLTGHLAAGNQTAAMVLGDMADAVRRADAVIRGLLEFSADNPREVKAADLSAILEQALRAVQPDLASRAIGITPELAGDLPPLQLDAKTLKHVFINLFMYAMRAMPGGGQLTVRTCARRLTEPVVPRGQALALFKPGEMVVLAEVTHTRNAGPDELPPSAGLPSAGRPIKIDGSLGLNVLKKTIELYGGVIDVIQHPDVGSRYTVMFKATEATHEKKDPGHR